jgi:hypothetical protein
VNGLAQTLLGANGPLGAVGVTQTETGGNHEGFFAGVKKHQAGPAGAEEVGGITHHGILGDLLVERPVDVSHREEKSLEEILMDHTGSLLPIDSVRPERSAPLV